MIPINEIISKYLIISSLIITTSCDSDAYININSGKGKIVFVMVDENYPKGLYTISTDGTELTPLLVEGDSIKIKGPFGGDFVINMPFDNPRWSPDGKKIAFNYSPALDISLTWVMDEDGTNISQIDTSSSTSLPKWSPDGNHILLLELGNSYTYYGTIVIDINEFGKYFIHQFDDSPQYFNGDSIWLFYNSDWFTNESIVCVGSIEPRINYFGDSLDYYVLESISGSIIERITYTPHIRKGDSHFSPIGTSYGVIKGDYGKPQSIVIYETISNDSLVLIFDNTVDSFNWSWCGEYIVLGLDTNTDPFKQEYIITWTNLKTGETNSISEYHINDPDIYFNK